MNRSERNQMVVDNLPLVGYLVSKVAAGATHLSRDDLAQAGAVALVKLVDSWEPGRGIPFGAYARERIIGAIKDEMRASDWASRGTRTTIKETLAVQDFLSAELGRTPTVGELAGALGVDRDTAAESLGYATRTVSSLEASVASFIASDTPLAEDELLLAEKLEYLFAAVEALPERMKSIVTRIYLDDWTVGEVAANLGVTHSAVSQQRAEAIRLLRDGMDLHYADADSARNAQRVSSPGARQTRYFTELAGRISASRHGRSAIAS